MDIWIRSKHDESDMRWRLCETFGYRNHLNFCFGDWDFKINEKVFTVQDEEWKEYYNSLLAWDTLSDG